MTSDDEKQSIDDSRFHELSPGKLLIWARERADLTQEQVAKELYMTLTKVRGLEAGDYRHMGSDTFVRGYLRAYANLVKLDVEQLLSAYDRYAQQHGLIEQVVSHKTESTNKPLWQFVVLVLAILLVLWLVSVWFFDNRQETTYNRPIAVVPPVETALSMQISSELGASHSSASSLALESIGLLAEDQLQVSETPADVPLALQNASVSDLKQSSSAASQSSVIVRQIGVDQLDVISFSFTQECWVEVSDARGDVLMADLQRAGSQLQLQGKAPFDVKLGNAPGAAIELNGDKVAIVPALGSNVLSLKVGAPTRE